MTGFTQQPLVVAIIGAGPSGIYAAEALLQRANRPIRIAIIDRLPVPFGLVRYGVAPDHHSIRSVRHTLEHSLQRPEVRFYGDVAVGKDITVDELRGAVDVVIYAYGAASDRRLGIDGEDLEGSIAAPDLVTWYCGHPDAHAAGEPVVSESAAELVRSTSEAVVVGLGNVALDVARILIKTSDQLGDTDMADDVLAALAAKPVTDVHIVGRRGPAYTAFTTKELREFGTLDDVDVIVDPADLDLDQASSDHLARDKIAARNTAVLSEWSKRPRLDAARRLHFHFWTRPVAICGEHRVSAVIVERTRIGDGGSLEGTGETFDIGCQLVVRSAGYLGVPLPGVPFDELTGRIPHVEGRVLREGRLSSDEYVTGWIKRGPTGVIGTNKSDAAETVASLLDDVAKDRRVSRHPLEELDQLLADRGVLPLDLSAWHRIDAAEIALGRSQGRDRATLAHRAELLAAAEKPPDPKR